MVMLNDLLSGLPEHLKNITNINFFMEAIAEVLTGTLERLDQVQNFQDVALAEGFALDVIGSKVAEDRMGRDDDTYRRALFSAIIRNRSKGTIEDVNAYARSLLGDNFINLSEEYPAQLRLRYLFSPLDNITDLIKESVSAGVNITSEIQTKAPLCGFTRLSVTTLRFEDIIIQRD